MHDVVWYLVLIVAGFLAGIINTIAGGGSFLTLPALLLFGLDPKMANGTNRVAILFSSGAAAVTFHKHGHLDRQLAERLAKPPLKLQLPSSKPPLRPQPHKLLSKRRATSRTNDSQSLSFPRHQAKVSSMIRVSCAWALVLAFIPNFSLANDPTGEVFPGLANFIDNRDQVYQRYAFVAMCEFHQQTGDKAPQVVPFCRMKIKSKQFDFLAYGKPLEGIPADGLQGELWRQYLHCGKKIAIRGGTVKPSSPFRIKPKEMSLSQFRAKCNYRAMYFQPFEHMIHIATFFHHPTMMNQNAEKIFLEGAELVSARIGLQGNVDSDWHWKWGSMDMDIKMTQSKACDFLPVRVHYTDRQSENADFYSDTFIEWKQVGELWVPIKLNAATIVNVGSPKASPRQLLAKFDWLVGDEVIDEFLDCDSDDPRIPLMELCERRFDMVVAGQSVRGEPWESPDDLEIEEATRAGAQRPAKKAK